MCRKDRLPCGEGCRRPSEDGRDLRSLLFRVSAPFAACKHAANVPDPRAANFRALLHWVSPLHSTSVSAVRGPILPWASDMCRRQRTNRGSCASASSRSTPGQPRMSWGGIAGPVPTLAHCDFSYLASDHADQIFPTSGATVGTRSHREPLNRLSVRIERQLGILRTHSDMDFRIMSGSFQKNRPRGVCLRQPASTRRQGPGTRSRFRRRARPAGTAAAASASVPRPDECAPCSPRSAHPAC
jgi:hypothetical protein